VITLRETVISGNGGHGFMSTSDGDEIDITESVFSGNRFAGVSIVGDGEVMLSRSWFVSNGRGVEVDMGRGWAKLSRITVMDNGDGVAFLGGEEADFTLQESTLLENGGVSWGAGLLVVTYGTVEIQGNLIGRNQHGIVMRAANPAKIYNNRILENEGWGVALQQPPCFDVPRIAAPRVVRGTGNEIMDNRKGDLCPPDYPWPEGFTTP
jgi:hypothetical protein